MVAWNVLTPWLFLSLAIYSAATTGDWTLAPLGMIPLSAR